MILTSASTDRACFARPGLVLSLLAAVALLAASAGAAHPEPDVTDQSWRLEFSYETPDAVAIEDADGQTQWFWYLPYKVVNETGEKQLFVPSITVADNNGRVVQANRGLPSGLFKKIKKIQENSLLRSPTDVAGTILTGEDYAKESVAIWPASSKDVNSFRIFIAGLSGETAVVENPRTGDTIQLQRTKLLEYETPGSFPTPENQTINFVNEEWVMR
jgi:hypothetical protein